MCKNGDPLVKKLLGYIQKDESQTLSKQSAEKVPLPAGCWRWGGRWQRWLRGRSRFSPFALHRLPPKGYNALSVLMVHDEMCFFLNAAQPQTSGLTACADPFTQVCKAAEHQPAVAKYRDTARPGLVLHMVQRSWPRSPHSRKAVATAERYDLTLMQPLLPEPAFLMSTP